MKCHCRLSEKPQAHAAVTDKADIHGLGCLLVEMCTGEPWTAGVLTLKVYGLEADHVKSPLVHIMQRCLCIDPNGRPTAAEVQQVRLLCDQTQAAVTVLHLQSCLNGRKMVFYALWC